MAATRGHEEEKEKRKWGKDGRDFVMLGLH